MDIENVLCQEIFGRGTFLSNPENWIERVLRDIHIRLVLQQHIVLSSHSYIDAIGFSPVVFSEPDWAQKERVWTRNRPTDEEFLLQASVYLGRVLRCWFDLPGSYITKGRAQLVEVLGSRFGAGIFYMEQVWNLHQLLPRHLYRNPPRDYHINQFNKDRPYDPAAMNDFIHVVNSLPDTIARGCAQLEALYRSFMRFIQAYTVQLNSRQVDPRGASSLILFA